jgi:MFS family permease
VGLLSSADPVGSLIRISVLGFVGGVFMAFMAPAFQSMLPDLVPRRLLMNGIALSSAQFQSARLLGPLAAAALVLSGAGMGEVFYVNAVSFLFVIAALWAIRLRTGSGHGRPDATAETAARAHSTNWRLDSWHQLTAGLRYARGDRVVGMLILGTAIMTVCAFPYMTLLPAIVSTSLGLSGRELSRAVAFVMAANGLGALGGALVVAGLPAGVGRNRLIPFTLAALAVLLVGFALSHWLPLTLALSTRAGAALLASSSLTLTFACSRLTGALSSVSQKPKPAARPVAQAQAKLYPPMGPKASSTSPQKKSPEWRRLSRVAGWTWSRATPPPVTSAFL